MSTLNVRKDGRRPRILTEKEQEREDRREILGLRAPCDSFFMASNDDRGRFWIGRDGVVRRAR